MKKIYFVFCMLLIINFLSIIAVAENTLSSEAIDSTEKETLLKELHFSESDIEYEEELLVIDINDSGIIAVGSRYGGHCVISLYNSNGDFNCSYEFSGSGDFGLGWEEDELVLYIVRGDYEIIIDENGEISDVFRLNYTGENKDEIEKKFFSTECYWNNNKYTLKKADSVLNNFINTYSYILHTEDNGKETVFCNVGNRAEKDAVSIMFVFTFIIVVNGIVITKKLKNNAD